jgi:hypothetical protein
MFRQVLVILKEFQNSYFAKLNKFLKLNPLNLKFHKLFG